MTKEERATRRDELEEKILALLTEEGVNYWTARSAMEHLLERMQKGFKIFLDDSAASDVLRDLSFKSREYDRRLREDP